MARARSPSSLEAGRCFLNCSFNKMENETEDANGGIDTETRNFQRGIGPDST